MANQCKRILKVLKRGHKITTFDAFLMHPSITRLGARISELRSAGHPITDKWIKSRSGVRYKAYFINELFDKSQLI